MADTRWFRSAHNVALAGTLKNGVGLNAPALVEDTSFPMAQAIQHDRMTPWKTPTTPASSPVKIDIDFGSTLSIYAMGVHRYELLSGTAGTLTMETQTGTYDGTGTWNSFGTITSANLTSSKDRASLQTSGQSARSGRWSFAHTSAVFSVGKLWAVIAPTLTKQYAKDSILTPTRYITENVDANGAAMINDYNEDGFLWSMDMGVCTAAEWIQIKLLLNSGRSLSMLDDADKLEEVRVVGGQIPAGRAFDTSYFPRIELARLP